MDLQSNRRQHCRSEIQIPVAYRRPDSGLCWTRTVNVSAGGLKIRAMEPIPEGTSLEISLHVPTRSRDRVLSSRASVVWCRPENGPNPFLTCGIMFKRLMPELLQGLSW